MERLKLTGVGEGLSVVVSTIIAGADKPTVILETVQNIFPSFSSEIPEDATFPVERNIIIADENVKLDTFLEILIEQRTLDTALDSMSALLEDDSTMFNISRQAAMSGKVSFVVNDKLVLGGVITVEISGNDLANWLEAATWHSGRETIPRHVRDDYSMRDDGEAVTWH